MYVVCLSFILVKNKWVSYRCKGFKSRQSLKVNERVAGLLFEVTVGSLFQNHHGFYLLCFGQVCTMARKL